MAEMKDLIIQSLNQIFDNGLRTKEKIVVSIKEHIAKGNFTQEEIKPLLEKMYPPTKDEDGNIVEEFQLYTNEELLADEIQKLADECHAKIVEGFFSNCLGEPAKLFDCESYDQANIQGLAITSMMGLMNMTTEEINYKASGELECYPFTYEQMIQLASDMKAHVTKHTDEFNAKRLALINGVNNEEI